MPKRVWAGFSALCLLGGSEWMADLATPRIVPGILGFASRMLFLALLFLLLGLRSGGKHLSARLLLRFTVWGALFLIPLPIAFAGASGRVSTLTEYLALAFLPAGIAFFQDQLESDAQGFHRLLPALAGAGGAALLISYTIPATLVGRLWLVAIAAAVLVTGFAATRLHEHLQGLFSIQAATYICFGAAILGFSVTPIFWEPLIRPSAFSMILHGLRLMFLDAPVLFLTVWMLSVLPPTRFSAKYLLTLFVALAESFFVARAGFDWTVALGSALMLGASVSLLRPPQAPSTTYSLFDRP